MVLAPEQSVHEAVVYELLVGFEEMPEHVGLEHARQQVRVVPPHPSEQEYVP